MRIFLNLLPPERKKGLVKRFYWRFFLGQWMLVFLITLLVLGVMGALYFLVTIEGKQEIAVGAAQVTESHQQEFKKYEEKFDSANKSAKTAGSFLALHTSFSHLLEEIEATLPPNTRIEKLSTQNYTVFLTGSADTRDTFLTFQEKIKKNECFTAVNAPLSNLFSENNVQFEIDFTVKNTCLRGSVPKL